MTEEYTYCGRCWERCAATSFADHVSACEVRGDFLERIFQRRADVVMTRAIAHGGLCSVDGEPANALFTVALRDGRVFERCGIHGYGGSLRGVDALDRARLQAARPANVRIYVVDRALGNRSLYVPSATVARIDAWPPSSLGKVDKHVDCDCTECRPWTY